MISSIIIDDDYSCVVQLRRLLANFKDIKVVRYFVNPEEGLRFALDNDIDLLFLDIEMPLNGIEIAKQVSEKTMIIFTTSFTDYAFEGFQLNAIDYMQKPIEAERLGKALAKAFAYFKLKQIQTNNTQPPPIQQSLKIFVDRRVININIQDILYIQSRREYLSYSTTTKKYLSLGNLKDIKQQLDSNKFVQIHKSFIVNKDYIESYNTTNVLLKNNEELPIGRLFKTSFKATMV